MSAPSGVVPAPEHDASELPIGVPRLPHLPVDDVDVERDRDRERQREPSQEVPERVVERAVVLGRHPVEERERREDGGEAKELRRDATEVGGEDLVPIEARRSAAVHLQDEHVHRHDGDRDCPGEDEHLVEASLVSAEKQDGSQDDAHGDHVRPEMGRRLRAAHFRFRRLLGRHEARSLHHRLRIVPRLCGRTPSM